MKYVPIQTVLSYVSQNMRKQSDDDTILDLAVQAYRTMNMSNRWERKIDVLEVKDNMVELPCDWKKIVRVTWWDQMPCQKDMEDLCNSSDATAMDTTPQGESTSGDTIGPPGTTIFYRIWEQSVVYKHGEELIYMGTASNVFCEDCPNTTNLTCSSYFSLNPNGNMVVHNHSDGWICFDYLGEIYTEDGMPMIPDDEDLKQGLAWYAEAMEARNRMWTKEEAMMKVADDALQKAEVRLKRFRGRAIAAGLDRRKINSIQGRNLIYLRFKSVWT